MATHDLGYIHSLLNEYKRTGLPLGAHFDSISRESFADRAGKYSVSVTIDATEGFELGCEYVSARDAEALEEQVAGLDEGDRSEEMGDEGSACFPGRATVRTKGRGMVQMDELRVGDEVDDGKGFSRVVLFTHADGEVGRGFVKVCAEGGCVVASEGHLVFVKGRGVVAMKEIEVGDRVRIGREWREVSRVGFTMEKGLFHPQTVSGRITVGWEGGEGVVASCYTTAIDWRVGHTILWPLRMLGGWGITLPIRGFVKGDEWGWGAGKVGIAMLKGMTGMRSSTE